MQINPKKIVGSLGRRYGGKTFQVVRKFCYDSLAFGRQLYELFYLARKTYAPSHSDRAFVEKYYSGHFDGNPSKIKKGYVCMCDGRMFHGGLTDRIRGILTTYAEAKKQNVPFYIHWTSPFPLEDYLIPASFDWRIDSSQLVYDKKYSFPFIIEDEPDFHAWLRMKVGMKHHKAQIHVYSNADNARGQYKELYKELFKPSTELQRVISYHLKELGENYVAFATRFLTLLGDFDDCTEKILNKDEAIRLKKKVSTELLNLVEKVPSSFKILLTSDSISFLEYVKDLDPRFYIVKGDIKHIDRTFGNLHEVWIKTFVDEFLLMNAKNVTLLKTGDMYNSGFSRFAAEVGGSHFVYHEF